ncbi:hypothetical protein Pst134EB_008736 [Puccinia striiformis f. sp. tritici]|nr:hypothetical protein Pst134EB_008736 [Puccinia striiformis f. sp. tritici]
MCDSAVSSLFPIKNALKSMGGRIRVVAWDTCPDHLGVKVPDDVPISWGLVIQIHTQKLRSLGLVIVPIPSGCASFSQEALKTLLARSLFHSAWLWLKKGKISSSQIAGYQKKLGRC